MGPQENKISTKHGSSHPTTVSTLDDGHTERVFKKENDFLISSKVFQLVLLVRRRAEVFR
jgi:hypothetical protein